MSDVEKVCIVGLEREQGWMYYLDIGCNIMRSRMVRGGQRKKADDKPEVVVETGLKREDNYLYFVDTNGDVSRMLSRRGKKMKEKKKTFRMRLEPKKPERKTIRKTKYIGSPTIKTLFHIVSKLEKENVSIETMSIRWDILEWEEAEPDKKYEASLKAWMDKKAEYDLWVKEHSKEIKEYEHKKAIEKERRIQARIDAVRQQKTRLDKELEKLKQQKDEIAPEKNRTLE